MSKYRNRLPQLGDALFLTDGGLETTLVFHDGLDLPHFAAFDLLKDEAGRARLAAYLPRPGEAWQAPWTARVAAHLPLRRLATPRVVRPVTVTPARAVARAQRVASTEKEAMSG